MATKHMTEKGAWLYIAKRFSRAGKCQDGVYRTKSLAKIAAGLCNINNTLLEKNKIDDCFGCSSLYYSS